MNDHARWELSIGSDANPATDKPAAPATTIASNAASDQARWGKKVVLLVDSDAQTRESRAKMMRSLGATVHAAASAPEARTRFETGPYNLVLIDLGTDIAGAEQLAQEIKAAKPRQLVAFLVGRPLLVATSLKQQKTSPPARAASRPTPPPAVQKAAAPLAGAVDFGQRIRDAEAQQALDDIA